MTVNYPGSTLKPNAAGTLSRLPTFQPCSVCGASCRALGERFMLHHHIWRAIAVEPEGFLCVGCAEVLLGRRLVASDFLPCPLNWSGRADRSVRLQERMAGRWSQ